MKRIPEKDWVWYGRPGHFICGEWCRFHMVTVVGKYLISTVGAYVPPSECGGSERTESEWLKKNYPGKEIGFGRKYETMVFEAGKPCDAPKCGCGMPSISGSELDMEPANSDKEAREKHMELCNKWAKGKPLANG